MNAALKLVLNFSSHMIGFPKPKRTQKQARAAKRRKDAAYALKIRAQCVERDGVCRVGKILRNWSGCDGPSEWAHFGDKKRAHTRGQDPEKRHTTQGSLMLCLRHHRQYDAGELVIRALTLDGCDGPLNIAR